MEMRASELRNLKVMAADGPCGKVRDVYFDDAYWCLRYIVVRTGGLLSRKEVLVSPLALKRPGPEFRTLEVSLTKEEISNAPDISTDLPVSRQEEAKFHTHYQFPYYWSAAGMWATGPYGVPWTSVNAPSPLAAPTSADDHEIHGDTHLRSAKEVVGSHLDGVDGELGKVKDLILERDGLSVNALEVDLKIELPAIRVRIPREAIKDIDWATRTVRTDLTSESAKELPRVRKEKGLKKYIHGPLHKRKNEDRGTDGTDYREHKEIF